MPAFLAGQRGRGQLLGLGRYLRRGLDHFLQQLLEVFEAWRRNDDGVAPTPDIFGDAQEATASILFQGQNEGLPLDLDFGRLESVLCNRRLGRTVRMFAVRTVTKRR